MHKHKVDLILMPHSAPAFTENVFFPRRVVEEEKNCLKELAQYYAKLLGVPVIICNKCGEWESPAPYVSFLNQKSYFSGFSSICNAGGTLLAQLDSKTAGVICAKVVLDPAFKVSTRPATNGRWLRKASWNRNLCAVAERFGRFRYRISRQRRLKAREMHCRLSES